MRAASTVLPGLMAACGLLAACGADGLTPYAATEVPATDGRVADPPDPTDVTVALDPLTTPSPVCTDSIALRGSATPGADVFSRGGGGPASAVAHPVTGRFCLDVPLRPGTAQQVEVWAKHPEAGLSDPARVEIVHDPAVCDDTATEETSSSPGDDEELINIAGSATISSRKKVTEHAPANIIDGDLETWARWAGGWITPWASYDGWVMLSLPRTEMVERVVVRWRDAAGKTEGFDWAKVYTVLYAPTDMGKPDRNTWLIPPGGEVKEGKGGDDPFELDGEALRHLALYLEFNGNDGWEEGFAIAEIEIWVKPGDGVVSAPLDHAQRCEAGQ